MSDDDGRIERQTVRIPRAISNRIANEAEPIIAACRRAGFINIYERGPELQAKVQDLLDELTDRFHAHYCQEFLVGQIRDRPYQGELFPDIKALGVKVASLKDWYPILNSPIQDPKSARLWKPLLHLSVYEDRVYLDMINKDKRELELVSEVHQQFQDAAAKRGAAIHDPLFARVKVIT